MYSVWAAERGGQESNGRLRQVLHMDRNDYYGGESASLNLTQLYRKFREGMGAPAQFGKDRDYNVDLIPKLMMANGK